MLKEWEDTNMHSYGRNIIKNYWVSKVTMEVIVIGCNGTNNDKLPRNVNLSLKIYKNELQR